MNNPVRNSLISQLARQTGGYDKDYQGPILPDAPKEGATRQQKRAFDRKADKVLKHLQKSRK